MAGEGKGWTKFIDDLGGVTEPTPADYIDPPRGGVATGYTSESEPPIKLRPFIWLHGAGVPQAVKGSSAAGTGGKMT